MADISDTVPTLAVVAAFSEGVTRITGVGFIRRKESDRLGALVHELRRCGVTAHEEADGLVIEGSPAHAARVETYDDHRMAMSFALIGLRVPGIVIADADCVAKTFPDYFEVLATLGAPAGAE
jgi:3-phosphoshikimate 1-carboxyvinyltransferase